MTANDQYHPKLQVQCIIFGKFFNMLNKLNFVYLLFTVLLVNFTLLRPDDPPDKNTGAPGDGLCTDCHNNPGTQTGTISLSGLPGTIEVNTSYTLTISIIQDTPTPDSDDRAGFQLVILEDDTDVAGSIGTFSDAGDNVSIDETGGGNRVYLEHSGARLFGGVSTVTYTANWTSPSILPDSIFLYMAGILGNGGNGNDNDIMLLFSEGYGTSTMPPEPAATVKVQNADIFFPDSTKGFVMKDINGNCWRFLVGTTGEISSMQIPCPQ